MKKIVLHLFALLLVIDVNSQLNVVKLQTENKLNPLNVDVKHPQFSWQIVSTRRNTMQRSYEVSVYKNNKKAWSSGKINSDQSLHVTYDGPALQSDTKYSWNVQVSDDHGKTALSAFAFFQTGLLSQSDWKASWIESPALEDSVNRPSILFRKSFRLNKQIASATLYITAHGMYEAEINGTRVGDACLAPGWTSYNKRLKYQAYDVTRLLTSGNNAIGTVVGNGWYRGYLAWNDNKNIYGKTLGLLAQIMVRYSDGSTALIGTDDSWKSSLGAIKMSEIYHGETYDARAEQNGWSTAGFPEYNWSGVAVAHYDLNNLVAEENEPVRKHETFKAVRVITTPAGERVLDFGQNLVGWVQVKAFGLAGDSVVIRHAEVLDKAGNFYTDNLRAAKATASYILKGGVIETLEPHFTFFGFRYIKIENYPGEIKPENFTAIALYSDMKPTGSFSTSNPLINQLQHNIQWGQRGNFLDVPTDCPQRDERLGWTGDAQAFSRTASFNFNVDNFFSKWLKDVAADQEPNGAVPFVVPNVLGHGAVASTGWADVSTIVPWNMYLAYGDKKLLETQYPSMKAWVKYMTDSSKNDLWNRGFHFGDWLFYRPDDDNDGSSAVTDKYMIAQCFWAHSTQILINAANVLNKQDDVAYYTALLQRIKEAFMKEYVTPNGRLVSSTQTAYVLTLNFDMLPEEMRAQAAERLVENVNRYGHLTTGFLGTPYLCHVLSRFGHTDLAYKLLFNQDYPSWLYPVTMGATTIWERWDGQKPDRSFQTPGMNSFNHYAYGAIGDWMYRVMAGIDTYEDAPGYKRIRIQPRIGGDLKQVSASLDTYYGTVSSSWKTTENNIMLDVEIPANTYAVIILPAETGARVTESGKPIGSNDDVKINLTGNKTFSVTVGSGVYHFVITK